MCYVFILPQFNFSNTVTTERKEEEGVKLADGTIIPVTCLITSSITGNLTVCCCDKTNMSMFLSMQQRFLSGKCSKTPRSSTPSPSLTELRVGGCGARQETGHCPEGKGMIY